MHILCPHCRNPIEVVKLTPREEIACPSCGSSFRLESESTTGWQPGSDKLGKFELIETVGQGAFGTVYKARDPELDRTVAVKVPRAGNLAGPQELDRFLREARSVAQLHHPSIVTIHEVSQQDGVPYLVSDFVQGVTLADRLTAGRPTFRRAAEMIAAVADALQFAHERGVIHRDVKPSNIMIGDDGRPCVMDFGLAKRDADEITITIDGLVLGTPAYMSPEQARGDAHQVDGRGDVYSLAVILYELLTGELPFRGNKRMLLHQVLHEEPRTPRSLNDHIPRDLDTICLKAMAKEPARRYGTARELADDLRRFLRGEPILARPVGRLERGWRWCRRNPVVAGLVVAVAGVLLLGTAVSTVLAVWALGEKSRADENAVAARESEQQKEREASHARDAERIAIERLAEVTMQKGRAERHLRLLADALAPVNQGMNESARHKMFREYLTVRYAEDTPLEFRRRIEDAEQALQDLPEDITKKVQLSRVLALHHLKYALSLVDEAEGRKLALQTCDRAVKILEQDCVKRSVGPGGVQITLRETNDANRVTWIVLRLAYAVRANVLSILGRHTDADADYQQALGSDSDDPDLRLRYVDNLFALRQYDRVTAEAEKLLARADKEMPLFFALDAAKSLAGKVTLLKDDGERADCFASLALRWLRRALADGHSPKGILGMLLNDDAFAVVRARQEYRKLIRELEAPPKSE